MNDTLGFDAHAFEVDSSAALVAWHAAHSRLMHDKDEHPTLGAYLDDRDARRERSAADARGHELVDTRTRCAGLLASMWNLRLDPIAFGRGDEQREEGAP